jgi:hypothetical protein
MTTSTELDELAAEIRRHHSAAKDAIKHAVEAGRLLLQAKAKLKAQGKSHGKWLPWLRENCEISERTAQDYMQAAAAIDAMKNAEPAFLENLTLHGFLKMLRESGDESDQKKTSKYLATVPHKKRKANPPRVTAATIRETERRTAEALAGREEAARRDAAEKAFAAQGVLADLAGPTITIEPTNESESESADQDVQPASGSAAPAPEYPADPGPIPLTDRLRTWLQAQPESDDEVIGALTVNLAERQQRKKTTMANDDPDNPVHATPLPQNALGRGPRFQWQPNGTITSDPDYPDMPDIQRRNPSPANGPNQSAADINKSDEC